MRLALDAMGGDYAPQEAISGAIAAADVLKEETVIFLIGDEAVVRPKIPEKYQNKIQVVHAPEVIGMGEHPVKALSAKPQSSINIGYGMLKARKADAFCSAGNTGAMHVGAMFSVKSVEGIIRPAIAGLVPKEGGNYGVILDVGANAECKPDVLTQFAQLGDIYAREVLKIENPKVGLMNLGEEEEKGSLHTQAAHQYLKVSHLNFIGNIEGRDVFNDKADVIVCDGFVGNVILKMAENFYDLLSKRNKLDSYFDQFNYEEIGGSPILGINGNVIIGHGVSTAKAFKNILLMAEKMVESGLFHKIQEYFKN
ncbi:MAG: phosphate acyltransferase PlsX [Cytophagales bacterium]